MKRRSNPNHHYEDNPSFLPGGEPVPSQDLPAIVRKIQDGQNTVILSISGKDSLAAWLFLREHDFDVIPYFCYVVPDLSYDVEWISYLENFFNVPIYRFLHPISARMLEAFAYQPPERVGLIARMRIQRVEFADLEWKIIAAHDLHPHTFSAVGIRAADNMMRSRLVRQMGPLGFKKRRYWWAVWDFTKDDCMAIIRKHGAKLSHAYSIWGATGDILDYPTLMAMRRDVPEDFEKIKAMYPLIEAEFFRYEGVR